MKSALLVAAVSLALAILGAAAQSNRERSTASPQTSHSLDARPSASNQADRQRGAVHVNRLEGPPTVLTDDLDADGNRIAVSCSSCHATREPSVAVVHGDQLTEFHTGLTTVHGDLTCLSCHSANDYDTLRRADGTSLSYRNVMQLCGQCHGPQLRDYRHGSHGGMTGHWNLAQGDRQRNNCIDCHDAHAPAFPVMRPVFAPLPAKGGDGHD